MKVPPAFNVPAPVNTMEEDVPAEVILPVTVTVPVVMVSELARDVVA
jgi:hypothetical protein